MRITSLEAHRRMEYAKEIFIGHGYDKIRGIHYFQGVDDLYSAVLVVQ
jgi:hypothetical protein